jgi:hypothetical protein
MQQKTKNHQNQGSIDKKFDFFPQSLSHITRWVHLVQKTQEEYSHAWAPLTSVPYIPLSFNLCPYHLILSSHSYKLSSVKPLFLTVKPLLLDVKLLPLTIKPLLLALNPFLRATKPVRLAIKPLLQAGLACKQTTLRTSSH